jgi:hypothetical protein
MGLWKKLLGREEEAADAFGQPVGSQPGTSVSTPLMSFQSTPVEASWSTVMVNGKPLPPDQAQAFTSAFEQLGNVVITDPNAATSVPPPTAEAGDPVGRLKQLDELRDQGVLTDAEFDAQKKKLLEEL